MSIDLNQVLPPQSPVTVVVAGQINLTTIRSTFEAAVSNFLTNAGLPPASLTIDYGFVSVAYTAVVTCRTTTDIVTPWQVAYATAQAFAAACGNPPTAYSVKAVGAPGDVVTPATTTGAAWLDALGAGVGSIATVAKWAAIVIIIGIVLWLAFSSGAAGSVRAAFA